MAHVTLPEIFLPSDYAPGALEQALRSGDLVRIRRGAYRRPGSGTRAERHHTELLARCVAVCAALTGRFAFSHQTAALLHGLPVTVGVNAVHLLQTVRTQGDSAADLIRHLTQDLPDEDLTTVAELPVTTLRRTLLDCARTLHPREALAVADAIMRRLVGIDRFVADEYVRAEITERAHSLDRVHELGRAPGVVQARAILHHADGRAESPGESRLRWLALSQGFAAPVLQARITTPIGDFYPDLGWRGEDIRGDAVWVLGEYDGVAKYQTRKDLFEEKRREDALRDAGCLVIRATKEDIARPRRVLQLLQRHVRKDPQAPVSRRGLAPPPPRRQQ